MDYKRWKYFGNIAGVVFRKCSKNFNFVFFFLQNLKWVLDKQIDRMFSFTVPAIKIIKMKQKTSKYRKSGKLFENVDLYKNDLLCLIKITKIETILTKSDLNHQKNQMYRMYFYEGTNCIANFLSSGIVRTLNLI